MKKNKINPYKPAKVPVKKLKSVNIDKQNPYVPAKLIKLPQGRHTQ